jgi:alpha-tubulin suppressor-like RCC1 family protein
MQMKKRLLVLVACIACIFIIGIGIANIPTPIDEIEEISVMDESFPVLKRRILASYNHTIGLKDDGTILVAGWEGKAIYTMNGEVHYSEIANVRKLVGTHSELAILHDDGSVSTTLNINDLDRFQEDIIDIAVGNMHIIGLKSDGTVIASTIFEDLYGETDVDSWQDIVAVYAGLDWSVGLRADGTVVASGKNDKSQCNVESWKDVVSIAIGDDSTLAITSDGTVLGKMSSSWLDSYPINLDNFRGCVQIDAGYFHLVGLKPDGTV